jgi:hypothetical protein
MTAILLLKLIVMPIHNCCKHPKHDSEVLDTDNEKVILETYSHFRHLPKEEKPFIIVLIY